MRRSREGPGPALPALLAEPLDSWRARRPAWGGCCCCCCRDCWRTRENLDRVCRVVCTRKQGSSNRACRSGRVASAVGEARAMGKLQRLASSLIYSQPSPLPLQVAPPSHLGLCRKGINGLVQRQKLLRQRHTASQDLCCRHTIAVQACIQPGVHKRAARCRGGVPKHAVCQRGGAGARQAHCATILVPASWSSNEASCKAGLDFKWRIAALRTWRVAGDAHSRH